MDYLNTVNITLDWRILTRSMNLSISNMSADALNHNICWPDFMPCWNVLWSVNLFFLILHGCQNHYKYSLVSKLTQPLNIHLIWFSMIFLLKPWRFFQCYVTYVSFSSEFSWSATAPPDLGPSVVQRRPGASLVPPGSAVDASRPNTRWKSGVGMSMFNIFYFSYVFFLYMFNFKTILT